MSDFSKNRVLALHNILKQYSDEKHPLTMREIIMRMDLASYSCSEDSILRYMKQLKRELDVDIISSRGRNACYYIGNRLLEKEELKLIIDSICASNFIEKNIADRMIEKLKSTMSIYDAEDLKRSVMGVNIAKTENKKILYNVNQIQEALNKGVQISFDYMQWNKHKKLEKRDSIIRRMNPCTLIWAENRYYLYGYDVKEINGKLSERHYRVDKMANIQLLDKPKPEIEEFKSFNADTYVSRRMGMFSGKEIRITVRVPEKLVGVFIDQFGKRITIVDDGEENVLVRFIAVPSNILYGWILGLNDVEVIEPQDVRDGIKKLLEKNNSLYEERN